MVLLSFAAAVGAMEWVVRELLLVRLIEVSVATHAITRGHTVWLLALQRAAIGSILFLALIQKVVSNCLVHTLSSNERAALILWLSTSHLTIGHDRLCVDVIWYHIHSGAELLFDPLTRFAAVTLGRLLGWLIIHVVVGDWLVGHLAGVLEGPIQEIGRLWQLRLGRVHHLSIVVLYNINIDKARLDIRPSLGVLQLLY